VSTTTTRRAVLAAALAFVVTGCGGSAAPPASPPSWEIEESAPSSAGEDPPRAVLAAPPESDTAPAADDASEQQPRKLASVPRPRDEQPSRGPRSAPVVLQIFTDFECPYCARTPPLLAELERDFGADLRIVWRALPLPGHLLARESATAALEAYHQRGNAGFWRVHDRLFVEANDGLTLQEIETTLKNEGVDVAKYRAALKSGQHDPTIAADLAAADAAAVEGTPAFLINDYYLYGSQDIAVLRSVIEQARDEKR
jgi:protein-disulfide isomerase